MARPKAPCGTYAAYRRHLREKTPVCAPCRDAKRENSRARSQSAASRLAKQAALEAEKAATVVPAPVAVTTDTSVLTRLETLEAMLETSKTVIAALATTDPARAYLQMREQREILREIAELQSQGEEQKESTLGDQLAAARAEREQREALRAAGA